MEKEMNGYEEAAKIDSIIEEMLNKFSLEENVSEWMKLTRTIHSSLFLLENKLLGITQEVLSNERINKED